MYSISDLETLLEVAQSGGVTAASRRLSLSLASVSHRLAKIETALGLKLFHRNSRNFHLSDEGRVFVERVEPLLRDLKQAEAEAGAGRARLRGTLRMTLSPWVLARFILPHIGHFQAQHPDLNIEFLAVDRFVPLVEEGQDCAIRVGLMNDSALIAQKLADNDRIMCASPSYLDRHGMPTSAQDLQDAHWVALPWQKQFLIKIGEAGRRSVRVTRGLTVSNSDIMTEAAVQGLGLVIKSRLAVKQELTKGDLVEILPGTLEPAEAPIWFVYPPDARVSWKITEIGRFLQKVFAV